MKWTIMAHAEGRNPKQNHCNLMANVGDSVNRDNSNGSDF